MFECGEHYNAILRMNDLIYIVDDKPLYISVRVRKS